MLWFRFLSSIDECFVVLLMMSYCLGLCFVFRFSGVFEIGVYKCWCWRYAVNTMLRSRGISHLLVHGGTVVSVITSTEVICVSSR